MSKLSFEQILGQYVTDTTKNTSRFLLQGQIITLTRNANDNYYIEVLFKDIHLKRIYSFPNSFLNGTLITKSQIIIDILATFNNSSANRIHKKQIKKSTLFKEKRSQRKKHKLRSSWPSSFNGPPFQGGTCTPK